MEEATDASKRPESLVVGLGGGRKRFSDTSHGVKMFGEQLRAFAAVAIDYIAV